MPRNRFLLSFLEFQKFRLIQSIVLFLFKAGYCYIPHTPNLLYRLSFLFLAFCISFCILAFSFFPSKILLFYLLGIANFVSSPTPYDFFQLSHKLIWTDWFLTVLPSGNIESSIFSFQFNSYGVLTQYREFGEPSFLNGHSCSALLPSFLKTQNFFSNYHHPPFPSYPLS